jgi:hypothetical protein
MQSLAEVKYKRYPKLLMIPPRAGFFTIPEWILEQAGWAA